MNQVEEFLKVVKSELKKNAVGVVFRAFNARLSAKYRPHENHRENSMMSIQTSESSSGTSTPSASQTLAPERPGPTRLRTTSFPMQHAKLLSSENLMTSPTSTTRPLEPASSPPSPPRDTDTKSVRGRAHKAQKVFDLFRPHKKRRSVDASQSVSLAVRPLAVLDMAC